MTALLFLRMNRIGTFALIANRTIDTEYVTYTMTPLRQQHFDMTLPVFRTHLVVLSKAQAAAADHFSKLFDMFSAHVWLLLAAVRHKRGALGLPSPQFTCRQASLKNMLPQYSYS